METHSHKQLKNTSLSGGAALKYDIISLKTNGLPMRRVKENRSAL